ncbi:MAG: hypothetical protein LAO78_13320 [Acidobacteriia bacterium]|nr:hypothetical protein [Terriglobia bacterium]
MPVLSTVALTLAVIAQPSAGLMIDKERPETSQNKGDSPQGTGGSNIDFEGGTLAKYVEHLRTKFPNSNIIIDGDVGNTTLPPVHLRVSLSQALQWISGTIDARNRSVLLQTTNGSVYTFTTQAAHPRTAETDVVIKTYVQANSDGTWAQPTGAALKEVLGGLLQKRDANRRGVDFDAKSRLLIVTGTRSDIQMVDQVIDEIAQGGQNASSLSSVQTAIDKLNARIKTLEGQVIELRKSK